MSGNNYGYITRSSVPDGTIPAQPEELVHEGGAAGPRVGPEVLFPHRVAYIEAVLIEILLFFDGPNTAMGVSIYVRNTMRDGKIITRLLKNKIKLVPSDANTTPRSELLAALICTRLLNLLQGDLKIFFELFQGEVKILAFGDSQVVLSQLLRDSYCFKLWVAVRVSEIQSLISSITPTVLFYHIPGSLNAADILTRPYKGPPSDLPYVGDCVLDTSSATLCSEGRTQLEELPELNRKQVYTNVSTLNIEEHVGEVKLDVLLSLGQYYNQMRINPCINDSQPVCSIITDLMERFSRWELIKNILARIFYFGNKTLGSKKHKRKRREQFSSSIKEQRKTI